MLFGYSSARLAESLGRRQAEDFVEGSIEPNNISSECRSSLVSLLTSTTLLRIVVYSVTRGRARGPVRDPVGHTRGDAKEVPRATRSI